MAVEIKCGFTAGVQEAMGCGITAGAQVRGSLTTHRLERVLALGVGAAEIEHAGVLNVEGGGVVAVGRGGAEERVVAHDDL